MARKATSIPKRWRTQGVWYVPEVRDEDPETGEIVFDNRAEYAAGEKDPFIVRILPMSGNDFEDERASSRIMQIHIEADKRNQTKTIADPMKMAEEFAAYIVAERCPEVRGYYGRGVDDEGAEVHIEPKTGAELVDYIKTRMWETERTIIDDIYNAIRDRSSLESGLGKKLGSGSSSSPQDTGPSNGNADSVGTITTMILTDPPRPSPDDLEIATVKGA